MQRVSLVFFISGAASLIFEIVWFHRCGLVFGNSVWAASLVLSSFMGGLALGSAGVGWYSDRIRAPLRIYAALEMAVGISGLALAYALPSFTRLFVPVAQAIGESTWLVNPARFVAAFASLLVPATAMGATLPVLVGGLSELSRSSIDSRRAREGLEGIEGSFGRTLGRLYGWNTIGAVVGVLGAEVVLIDRVGVTGSAWVAALLDAAAAAAAFALSRRAGESSAARPVESGQGRVRRAPSAGSISGRRVLPRALLACAFLAGANLLTLEVVWFRFLSMYVLSTTLAASVMLAVVLAAIGVGALLASIWQSQRPAAVTCLPALAVAAGCSVVLSYVLFESVTEGTQVGEWSRIAWFTLLLSGPTSLVSGMIFTLLGEAIERRVAVETKAAAWLTLANTAGAACGPLLAAFVLLPALGMERTLAGVAIVYGVVGLVASATRLQARPRRSPAFLLALVVLIVALWQFPFGSMRGANFSRAAEVYAADGAEIVATREGPSETIFLMQRQWMGKPVYSRLVTNGFSMSGTAMPALRYMRYFVYWPMLVHPAPLRRVLVICYGVGATAGAATDVASAESIDVVEISRDVVAASDLIYPPERHPLRDPRVRLHIEDGRQFLQTTRERFDLITGEPPPPRTPGAVNIYTREYFQLIHDRLAHGGIATYWVPVARPSPGTDVSTIIHAFCDVFDDCTLWNGTPFDLMLAGTRGAAGPVSESAFARPWVTPTLEARLREVGFEAPQQIGATFIGDASYLRALTADVPPLTDDFPQRLRPVPTRPSLSDPRYGVDPRVAELYQNAIDPVRAREAFRSSDFIRRFWPEALIEKSLPFFDTQRILNRVIWDGGQPIRQIEDLHALLTQTTLRTLPLWLLGTDEARQQIAEASPEQTGEVAYARALRALSGRDYLGAAAFLAEAERRGVAGATTRPLQAYALFLGGQKEAASNIARGIVPRTDDERHFWEWLKKGF